jgi:hypothetical protein
MMLLSHTQVPSQKTFLLSVLASGCERKKLLQVKLLQRNRRLLRATKNESERERKAYYNDKEKRFLLLSLNLELFDVSYAEF